MLPLLFYQKLIGYVDGSIPQPPSTIVTGEMLAPHPDYTSWIAADQRSLILLQLSLSKEAMTILLMLYGLPLKLPIGMILLSEPTFLRILFAILRNVHPLSLSILVNSRINVIN